MRTYASSPQAKARRQERDSSPEGRARQKRENATPEAKARQKAYRQTVEGKETQAAATGNMRRKYPEKVTARNAVASALKRGILIKQPCELCTSTKVEAHHADYSKPLDVTWLCVTHHREQH